VFADGVPINCTGPVLTGVVTGSAPLAAMCCCSIDGLDRVAYELLAATVLSVNVLVVLMPTCVAVAKNQIVIHSNVVG